MLIFLFNDNGTVDHYIKFLTDFRNIFLESVHES